MLFRRSGQCQWEPAGIPPVIGIRPLRFSLSSAIFQMVLEGRRIARPFFKLPDVGSQRMRWQFERHLGFWQFGEGLGGKSEHQRARCRVTQVCWIEIYAGGKPRDFPTDSATENRQPHSALRDAVMVKRCGKSAPREAQVTRHGKPHRVQGQIGNPGAARSGSANAERVPGIGCSDK